MGSSQSKSILRLCQNGNCSLIRPRSCKFQGDNIPVQISRRKVDFVDTG